MSKRTAKIFKLQKILKGGLDGGNRRLLNIVPSSPRMKRFYQKISNIKSKKFTIRWKNT